jgi:hypothetical protein
MTARLKSLLSFLFTLTGSACLLSVLAAVAVLLIPAGAGTRAQQSKPIYGEVEPGDTVECDKCPKIETDPVKLQKVKHWPPGAHVAVNFGGRFTNQAQMAAVIEAFVGWQMHPQNSTGVIYDIWNDPTLGAGDSRIGRYYMDIFHQNPDAYQGSNLIPPGAVHVGAMDEDGFQTGHMMLSPNISDLDALKQTAAHEIGHTLGLAECPTCCPGASVMGTVSPDATGDYFNDTKGGRIQPSNCDAQKANEALGTPNPTPSPTPSGGRDNCVQYVWLIYMTDPATGDTLIDVVPAGCF